MNRATKTITSILGIMLGIAGLNHGFFETLQGNTATNGLIIQAIGDAQQMWVHGTEEAFTIVPNFLITGLLAIAVSLTIMVWSVRFILVRSKYLCQRRFDLRAHPASSTYHSVKTRLFVVCLTKT